tara:strand:+ start:5809 stop:8127 length:2319 start_codon:yes stop_codon:yes gene_type:complete
LLRINTAKGTEPTTLSAIQIFEEVEKKGGFVYAAHCTDDSGVLKKRLHNIWVNNLLKAAQIPKTIQTFKVDGDQASYQILLNKDPSYKRERSIAIINAKDIVKPEDLKNSSSSCLIKMTNPSFEAFKQAFLDPESRVRLNYDVTEIYYSCIDKIKFTCGYLSGIEIDLSEHLNAIIGGRGVGKSTLIECIRYTLDLEPIGQSAHGQHNRVIKNNLGQDLGKVELTIKSAIKNGKVYIVSRVYGEFPVVKDLDGNISRFSPRDLLPGVEIFWQNEITEIAKDNEQQLLVLQRFLNIQDIYDEEKIADTYQLLSENRLQISNISREISELEDNVYLLAKHEEDLEQFTKNGLDKKLEEIPKIESDKRILNELVNRFDEFNSLNDKFNEHIKEISDFNSNYRIMEDNSSGLKELKSIISDFGIQLNSKVAQYQVDLSNLNDIFNEKKEHVKSLIHKRQVNIESKFKEIPAMNGKSGKEIGRLYQELQKNVEQLKSKNLELIDNKKKLENLTEDRRRLMSTLSSQKVNIRSSITKGIKKINRKLEGKLRVTINAETNRASLIDFLDEQLSGISKKRLDWINSAPNFSTTQLAEKIKLGSKAIEQAKWGCPKNVAEALGNLNLESILEIEELKIQDTTIIELNTSNSDTYNYKPLDHLSIGQQCTAILLLLLIDNQDPLIMDQPEDNLDNSFIAEKIVSCLREAKLTRQFIFATHNANIPIYGDSEWIGALKLAEKNDNGPIIHQGSIDLPNIQNLAAELLEGGEAAFIRRKEKYGF